MFFLRHKERKRRILCKQKICFIHIPKCGGTSIHRAIKSQYQSSAFVKEKSIFKLDSAASFQAAEKLYGNIVSNESIDDRHIFKLRNDLLMYYMAKRSTNYISGHFAFNLDVYNHFSRDYAFVTVLRNPVQRWISSYFFNRYKRDKHRKVDVNIDDYLETKFAESQGYEYVKFLGGVSDINDYSSEAAVERAKENLSKFSLVGFIEQRKDLIEKFNSLLSEELKIDNLNRNPVRRSRQRNYLTPEVTSRIEKICRPDIEVYDYAMKYFFKGRSEHSDDTGRKNYL
jgi:hypothetical protein